MAFGIILWNYWNCLFVSQIFPGRILKRNITMAPALKKVKLELVKLPGILLKSLNLSETNDNEDAGKKTNSNVDIRNVRRGKILDYYKLSSINFKNRKHYFTIFFQKIIFS